MQPLIVTEAISYIKELFACNSDGHGADHTMRVFRSAMTLASEYDECDTETVALAALLHDADDYKLFSTENNAKAPLFVGASYRTGKDRKDMLDHQLRLIQQKQGKEARIS